MSGGLLFSGCDNCGRELMAQLQEPVTWPRFQDLAVPHDPKKKSQIYVSTVHVSTFTGCFTMTYNNHRSRSFGRTWQYHNFTAA